MTAYQADQLVLVLRGVGLAVLVLAAVLGWSTCVIADAIRRQR